MGDGRTLYVILSANAAAYNRALKGSSRETVDFGRNVDTAGLKVDDLGRKTNDAGAEVDKLSGRLRIALDLLATIGPAVLPISAVAIPALGGMTAQMVLMGVAGGASMLALVGIADALKAVQDAQLEPTAANLEKMRQALANMPADAREFVMQLDAMEPMIDQLRDASASGFFGGGLTDSLGELEDTLPAVKRLVRESASALGDMAEQGVEAFDSKGGRRFLRFLEREVRDSVTSTLQTLGNLTAGLGNMWRGFDPLNDDFSDWLLEQSRSFRTWSDEMNRTDGYRGLFDYIRDNGPQVADTLGSIGSMGVDLVQALAPLGGPALQGIELFADAVSIILDSPIGPPLLAGAAAATLLNRGLQLTNSLIGRIGAQSAGGSKLAAGAGTLGKLEAGAWKAAAGAGHLANRLAHAGQSAQFASERTLRAREATAGYARAAAGGLAAIGALTVLSTEQGQQLGITNTALLGLTGSMVGPFGAAAGASVGLVMDLVGASKKATSTLDDLDKALKLDNGDQLADTLAKARAELDDLRNVDTSDPSDIFQKMGSDLRGVWNGDFSWEGSVDYTREREAALEAVEQRSYDVANAQVALGKELGILDRRMSYANVSADDWRATLERAEPAMRALGITTEDLYNMDSGELAVATDRIRTQIKYVDSGKGRMDAYGASVADLANDMLSTADSASTMSAALEALLKPSLDLEAATDGWRASLAELEEKLKEGAGFKGFSAAAMENRELTRSYAEDVMGRLSALAAVSTTTEEDMAVAVRASREEFIKSGLAAGFSRKEIVERANALGLTPKLVQTTFEAAGITQYELKVRGVREQLKRFPRSVRTAISAEGIPETSADVDRLVEKYGLSEKERTAVLSIMDLASGPMREILLKLLDLGRQKPTPTVGANTAAARAEIAAMRALLADLNGTTATTYVRTVRSSTASPGPGPQPMDGGDPGTGGGGAKPEPTPRITPRASTDGRYRYSGGGADSGLTFGRTPAGASRSGTTTINEGNLIGRLEVVAERGATLEDVDNTASAVVRAAGLASRSGRWKKRGN